MRGSVLEMRTAVSDHKTPAAGWEFLTAGSISAFSVIVLYLLLRSLRHDDAYIIYQYARNLSVGNGFVFNAGERVLGVTTPLLTLLLAVAYRVAGEVLPQVSIFLGCAGIAAQAMLLFALTRDRLPVTAWVLLIFTISDWHGSMRFAALETNLYGALLLGTVYLAGKGTHPIACGALLGLAFLCRHDAVLLVPVILLIRGRSLGLRAVIKLLLASLLVVLPWLVFAWIYFGSPLPQTLHSKHGISSFTDYSKNALMIIVETPWQALGPRTWLMAAGIILAAAGTFKVLLHLTSLRLLTAFCGLQFLAYAMIGPPLGQTWHIYLPQVAFNTLIAVGIGALLEETGGWRWCLRRERVAIYVAVAVIYGGLLVRNAAEFCGTIPQQFWLGLRHSRYEMVANWVNHNIRPHQAFLAYEVGTLGYMTQLRMVDPFGLINWTNEWPRTASLDSLRGLMRHYTPDVVLVNSLGEGQALEDSASYRIIKVFPWKTPWSTLLIRNREVLKDPSAFGRDSLEGDVLSGLRAE